MARPRDHPTQPSLRLHRHLVVWSPTLGGVFVGPETIWRPHKRSSGSEYPGIQTPAEAQQLPQGGVQSYAPVLEQGPTKEAVVQQADGGAETGDVKSGSGGH